MRELREIPGEDWDRSTEPQHGDESQRRVDHHSGENESKGLTPLHYCRHYQEIDKHWKIITETSIKAKSVRGYSTYNRKLTENKWKAGTEKPELVEDWDQRLVVTTLNRKEDGNILELSQIAEKDQVGPEHLCFLFYPNKIFFIRNFVLTASQPFKWSLKMKTSLL